jgi:hypothetical protein
MQTTLQTIPSNKINSDKWNKCVDSHNAKIYFRFDYLNLMADNWIGIILNDYEAIFPICYKKKFGITYSYTPAFVQQLGWIGNFNEWEIIENKVLELANYGDIMLNKNYSIQNLQEKVNYILNLNQSYQNIYQNYKSDLKQNLKKATKENLIYGESKNVDDAIALYKNIYADRMSGTAENDFSNFTKLCKQFQQTGNCIVREVRNEKNDLLAIVLLLKDNHSFYNLANSTTELGRKTEANHFLIDRILNEFSGINMIFDFEGSDLPGVKTFYQKFGATNEPYFHWHFNNLPWWIKWAKK